LLTDPSALEVRMHGELAEGKYAGLAVPPAGRAGTGGRIQRDRGDDSPVLLGHPRESSLEPAQGDVVALMRCRVAETHRRERRVGLVQQPRDRRDRVVLAHAADDDAVREIARWRDVR